ncbi:hypothetical protein [Martelella limonii]|uniref:hypothetical protein n=1 Tax=Martelella limonii TaxID=1647649 RepID=UPI001580D50B|nr:hypothetical protein [Martelella limonii]
MGNIADIIERLPALFAAEPDLVRRAARAEITILLQAGDQARRLILDRGTLLVASADGPMAGWDIGFKGAAAVFWDHWQKVPGPDAADIFGMRRHGRLVIEGNFLPLMRHLQVVKDILALPRSVS